MSEFWFGYLIGSATCVAATAVTAFIGWRRAFSSDPVDDYPPHGEWPRVPGAGALDNQHDGGRP